MTHPELLIPHTYDSNLKKLTIRGATEFPRELFAIADDIEILDMSFGHMTTLPDDFNRLSNLKIVFFSYNDFQEVPEALGACSNLIMIGFKSCKITRLSDKSLPLSLRALILTDNLLTSLPSSIGKLKHLQKLTVTGNRLTDVPRDILACTNLEFIRIAANQFSVLPEWLLDLPRLAWYSDAGNPGSKPAPHTDSAHTIPWHEITLGEEIGKSPKNIVYRAVLTTTNHPCAVKLYGESITADGYTDDEIEASLAAGTHENIIPVLGKLVGVPDEKQGLVMDLIPGDFISLGLPPDFNSLIRDTYPPDQILSISFVAKIVRGIASSIQHLHDRGITHGDIYAHNILINSVGYPYLGDFGAATLYSQTADHRRENVERRAFVHLVEELVARCEVAKTSQDVKTHELLVSFTDNKTTLSLTDFYHALR